jgi:hypothetical protein
MAGFIANRTDYCEPGSSVSRVPGYGLDDQALKVCERTFLQPLCPDWLWGPPSLQYIGYWRGPFPEAKA